MSYKVFARKWRPRNFAQVVGQEHIVRALVNGIENDRLHHAYLFSGTRGVGKTTIARVFAKALNCPHVVSAEPCGKCQTCLDIDEGRCPDLIEVDAASRTGVDDTRELLENVQYASVLGRYKVYLIDEVHMFSKSSFNALLKTLEEPPEHVKFLLATTDPQKLPVTVLSRCLQFNLKRLLPEQIEHQFQAILKAENIDYQQPAIERLAQVADGSMRDGLSLLDQAIVHGNGELNEADVLDMLGSVAREPVVDLLSALVSKQGQSVLHSIDALDEYAPDYADVLQSLLSFLHKIAVHQIAPSRGVDKVFMKLASTMSKEDVQLYYQIALMGQKDLPLAPSPKVGFEMVLLRMLAFSPVDIEVNDTQTVTHEIVPATPVVAKEVPSTQASKTLQQPEPVVRKKAPKLIIPEKKKLEQTQQQEKKPEIIEFDKIPWHELVPQLKLDPITLQLANNATLSKLEGHECELLLAPGHVSLNKKSEENLQQALSSFFDRRLDLRLRQDQKEVVTPNSLIVEKKAERQSKAEEDIANNTTVKKIIELFDAQVIDGSIKPIDLK